MRLSIAVIAGELKAITVATAAPLALAVSVYGGGGLSGEGGLDAAFGGSAVHTRVEGVGHTAAPRSLRLASIAFFIPSSILSVSASR